MDKTRQRVEGWWCKRNGATFWADISTSAIFNDGELSGYIVVAHDLTEKKKFEEEKFQAMLQIELERKRTENAKHNEKLQRDFTDRICHEVRNPLNGIYGCVELIIDNLARMEKSFMDSKKKASDSFQREGDLQTVRSIKEKVETIAECSEYQRMVTDEVLYLSSVEHRGLMISNAPYSPRTVVDSVVRMFKASCEKNTLHLELDYQDSTPQSIIGDKKYVQQVLTNLRMYFLFSTSAYLSLMSTPY